LANCASLMMMNSKRVLRPNAKIEYHCDRANSIFRIDLIANSADAAGEDNRVG